MIGPNSIASNKTGLPSIQHDVRQMQVTMATSHESLCAALLQQSANPKKGRLRYLPEVIDIAFCKAGCGSKRFVIALDECRDRLDPGFSRRERRDGVGPRNGVGRG